MQQGNPLEQKVGEGRFGGGFVRKVLREQVAREAVPARWWAPAATHAVPFDGRGPGRYGRVGLQPSVVNNARRETLHLTHRSNLPVVLCTGEVPRSAAATATSPEQATPFDLDVWEWSGVSELTSCIGGATPRDYGPYQFAQSCGIFASPTRPLKKRDSPQGQAHSTVVSPKVLRHTGYWGNVLGLRGAQQQQGTCGAPRDWSCVSRDTGPLNAYGSRSRDERELGPPREVDVCGDLMAQHFPREVNDRVYEKPEELAILAGMNWVSQYLASNPEMAITAQRVAAENNQQEKLFEMCVDARQILADAVGATDVSPVHTTGYQTSARTRQLAAWRLKARNPDDQPDTWLLSGILAGTRIMPLNRGVFPVVHNAYDDPELHGDQEPEGTDALRDAGAGALSTFAAECRDRGRVCMWCMGRIELDQMAVNCDICDAGPFHVVHCRRHRRLEHGPAPG